MLVTLTTFGLLVLFAAEPIVAVFTTNPTVADIGATFMRYTALMFEFIGVMRAYSGGFRDARKTLLAAAVAILTLGVIRFPLAWIGADMFGSLGIWFAFAISNVIGGLIAYL